MYDLEKEGREYKKKKRQMETMIIHMDNDLRLTDINVAYYSLDEGERQLIIEKINTKLPGILKEVQDDLKNELANHLENINSTVEEIKSKGEAI